MNYTIHKVANLSGVSIRTLRYYDEIGLLKPAFVGENNYRYYQEEQLLRLQQILFFKELGFSLKQIQTILDQSDFDKLKALQRHAQEIKNRIDRLKMLSKTIDKTINYLKGKQTMTKKELYYGLHSERQKKYEQYILDTYGDTGKKLMSESKQRTKNWKQEDWDRYKTQGEEINIQLVQALQKGLAIDSPQVQALIEKHYHLMSMMYHPTKEVYIGLGELYTAHPEFRSFFEHWSLDLADFMAKAMKVYADKNL